MVDCAYMSRNAAAIKLMVRTALTCVLCVLAIAFALEAKAAWYGPASGPGSDVRAAKAMPASLPRVVEHGFPATGSVHPQVLFALLSAPLPACLISFNLSARRQPRTDFARVSSAAFFSPQFLFRPPPSRS